MVGLGRKGATLEIMVCNICCAIFQKLGLNISSEMYKM